MSSFGKLQLALILLKFKTSFARLFFFRAGAQDGIVIKVARTTCKLKIFYIFSIMLQKLGRKATLDGIIANAKIKMCAK